ncbi:hypothetical protein B0T26DRAFT_701810 [Lasiosphaeria miniovina]|uniref:Uncharacterized protein n=1 Tax=Lasiosphaeria miniovina TaxID=1954250 RepID=A0AA40AUK4_9PEZI|nr:uncharacterized protein B0T26DRAFT_701810 [Lasiosphaeria miniovina]KAK0722204.1 hypothetical protein B0T26DRAFT_701810 [Lasiosphaeria miniovina]
MSKPQGPEDLSQGQARQNRNLRPPCSRSMTGRRQHRTSEDCPEYVPVSGHAGGCSEACRPRGE